MSNPLALDNLGATGLVFGPLVGSVLAENRRFGGDLRRRYSDRTYWQLQAWQLAGLVSAVLLAKGVPGATLPGSPWLWVVLGCAVGLAGVTLRWWAIRTLGKQFTRNLQVGSDHELVVAGPYRYVRHPSYTGAILMLAGVGLGLGNALSLAACLVLPAIGYIQRISREEELLQRELGEPYAEYASQRRRLVPGVY
jgi:protein-S-isoprenylcysteine O-methyltransferase Ste14